MILLDVILGRRTSAAAVVIEAFAVIVSVSIVLGVAFGRAGVTGPPFILMNTIWIFISTGYYMSQFAKRRGA